MYCIGVRAKKIWPAKCLLKVLSKKKLSNCNETIYMLIIEGIKHTWSKTGPIAMFNLRAIANIACNANFQPPCRYYKQSGIQAGQIGSKILLVTYTFLYYYYLSIAHKGLHFPVTRNFDWQMAPSKSPKQNQNLKFELLFRIDRAALSDIRSETKLMCALYKLFCCECISCPIL